MQGRVPFGQLIAASGRRKRINPLGPLKMGFARLCDAAGVDTAAVFPQMGQGALPWPASPHIWTRETIEREDIGGTVERLLPAHGSEAATAAIIKT